MESEPNEKTAKTRCTAVTSNQIYIWITFFIIIKCSHSINKLAGCLNTIAGPYWLSFKKSNKICAELAIICLMHFVWLCGSHLLISIDNWLLCAHLKWGVFPLSFILYINEFIFLFWICLQLTLTALTDKKRI